MRRFGERKLKSYVVAIFENQRAGYSLDFGMSRNCFRTTSQFAVADRRRKGNSEDCGTSWRIPLEQFDIVERALFRNVQKADETSDSYLSRSDVTWTELLNKGIKLEEVRSYILLRGSKLAGEDKKRVLVELGAETGSALDIKKVTGTIRMLGSNFFFKT